MIRYVIKRFTQICDKNTQKLSHSIHNKNKRTLISRKQGSFLSMIVNEKSGLINQSLRKMSRVYTFSCTSSRAAS